MQNQNLAKDYIRRARIRLGAVQYLYDNASYADVVREAQEAVELALKALLRTFGIEPPRIHDVSALLTQEKQRFPPPVQDVLAELTRVSREMRRDRELAFYGSEDLTPSDFYTEADAAKALRDARMVVAHVSPHIDA